MRTLFTLTADFFDHIFFQKSYILSNPSSHDQQLFEFMFHNTMEKFIEIANRNVANRKLVASDSKNLRKMSDNQLNDKKYKSSVLIYRFGCCSNHRFIFVFCTRCHESIKVPFSCSNSDKRAKFNLSYLKNHYIEKFDDKESWTCIGGDHFPIIVNNIAVSSQMRHDMTHSDDFGYEPRVPKFRRGKYRPRTVDSNRNNIADSNDGVHVENSESGFIDDETRSDDFGADGETSSDDFGGCDETSEGFGADDDAGETQI